MATCRKDVIRELSRFDSPTVCNAIESFDLRSRTAGYMGPEIKAILPPEQPLVGYACTARISARKPPTSEQRELGMSYYRQVRATPNPTISVIEDIDPVPTGSFWGEVQTSIHRALGCIGTITSGGVRDLDGVAAIGFGYFASCVLVSHAYVHLEEHNTPVEVGGLRVEPGDLLHADQHGVVLIPLEVASDLPAACRRVEYAEEPVIRGCRDHFEGDLDPDILREWLLEMDERRKGGGSPPDTG